MKEVRKNASQYCPNGTRIPISRLLLMLLALAGDVRAAEPMSGKSITFNTRAQVSIDTNSGHAPGHPTEELPEPVATFVQSQVMQWRFQPIQIDGQPRGGLTHLSLGACAAPVDGGYQLAVDYKGTGPASAQSDGLPPPPRYPAAAAWVGMESHSVVTFAVGTDGSATLESIQFKANSRGNHDHFEPVLRAWVAALRYLPEQVDGHPVRARMSVPVDFEMGASWHASASPRSPNDKPR